MTLNARNAIAPAAGEPAPGSGDPVAQPPVTLEAVSELLTKHNSDLRAEFGRKFKALDDVLASVKSGAPAAPAPASATPANTVEEALRARLTRMEERETRQQEKALRLNIREALVLAGAEPDLAAMIVPAVLEAERTNFSIGETSFGDFEIRYGDGTASVADWAKGFLATPQGKRLVAKRAAPSVTLPGGAPAAPAGKRVISNAQAKHLTAEELRSGMYIVQ